MYNPTDLTKYMVNAAQKSAPGNHRSNHTTPDNKLSEGIDSVQRHRPAPYLPLIRWNEEFGTYVVVSSQKPVAFATDTRTNETWLVPAGYALEAKKVKDAGGETQADTTGTIKYTELDVREGVKNAKGDPVVAGESVVKTFFEGADQKVLVSPFCGIANYNYFRHAGGDGVNPNGLQYVNYNPQPTVSYNMDYAFEYPVVKDNDEYAKAPLVGISAFIGEKAIPGQFVTYDENSNFVLADQDEFTYGTTEPQYIIGQISKFTKFVDPDTKDIKQRFEQLQRVINPGISSNNPLDQLPGSDTDGLTNKLTYANAYALVSFALQTR